MTKADGNNPIGESEKLYIRRYIATASSIFVALFFTFLFLSFYYDNVRLLQILNNVKYLIIPLLAYCIYFYYKSGSKCVFYILSVSLICVWFLGFDFPYRWDEIQHVARANYFLTHEFLFSKERSSTLYLMWGIIYRLFGESEGVTHLTNMLFGLMGIIGIYKICTTFYNRFTALVAFLTSLTMPVFFLVNKWAYLDMPFTALVIVSMYFLIKYLDNNKFLYIHVTFLLAFLALSIKTPGLVMFPIIFFSLIINNKINGKILALFFFWAIFSCIYLFNLMLPVGNAETLLYSQNELSIISPLSYGNNFLFIWASLFNQQIQQFIFSGILFMALLVYFKNKTQGNALLYLILLLQILPYLSYTYFPLVNEYFFPLFPFTNYLPQLGIFILFFILIFISYISGNLKLCLRKKEITLGIWILFFMLFFMVNGKVVDSNSFWDIGLLDFRYLMPAFPALIILFSAGVTKMLDSVLSNRSKIFIILLLSSILIFNYIISLNLVFYYSASGEGHLRGYNEIAYLDIKEIYTHWPFYYAPDGVICDIGKFKWKTSNISIKDIKLYLPSENSSLLFDSHFHSDDNLINFNLSKFINKHYELNIISNQIKEDIVDSVYIARAKNDSLMEKDGFYPPENWSGIPTRWMQANATLLVNSSEERTATLSMQARSFYRNRTLAVYAGDDLQTKAAIPSDGFVEIETPVHLVKGINAPRLHSPEGCERPNDIEGLNSTDGRCLSVAVQNIALGEKKFGQLKYIKGFHEQEDWSGIPSRWMQSNATLLINSYEDRTATLSLQAQSFYRKRTLEISAGGVPAAQVAVPTSSINVSVPIHLAEGENTVQFHVLEGCERPIDIRELNRPGERCLSVAFQNLIVT